MPSASGTRGQVTFACECSGRPKTRRRAAAYCSGAPYGSRDPGPPAFPTKTGGLARSVAEIRFPGGGHGHLDDRMSQSAGENMRTVQWSRVQLQRISWRATRTSSGTGPYFRVERTRRQIGAQHDPRVGGPILCAIQR